MFLREIRRCNDTAMSKCNVLLKRSNKNLESDSESISLWSWSREVSELRRHNKTILTRLKVGSKQMYSTSLTAHRRLQILAEYLGLNRRNVLTYIIYGVSTVLECIHNIHVFLLPNLHFNYNWWKFVMIT